MLKGLRQASTGTLVVCLAFVLSGCSGGSSSSSSQAQATALKSGVFDIGRLFSDGSTKEGISLLSPTGNFVVNLDRNSYSFGTLGFSDAGNISGQIVEYILNSTWSLTSATLSGEVRSAESADLRAKSSEVTSNSVLQRNPELSDLGVTLDNLSGIFMSDTENTNTFTIGTDGGVIGSDQRGCNFRGQVVIPDKTINVFELTYDASNCPAAPNEGATADDRNGEYTGLGTYDSSGNEVIFYSRNGSVAMFFKGVK